MQNNATNIVLHMAKDKCDKVIANIDTNYDNKILEISNEDEDMLFDNLFKFRELNDRLLKYKTNAEIKNCAKEMMHYCSNISLICEKYEDKLRDYINDFNAAERYLSIVTCSIGGSRKSHRAKKDITMTDLQKLVKKYNVASSGSKKEVAMRIWKLRHHVMLLSHIQKIEDFLRLPPSKRYKGPRYTLKRGKLGPTV